MVQILLRREGTDGTRNMDFIPDLGLENRLCYNDT